MATNGDFLEEPKKTVGENSTDIDAADLTSDQGVEATPGDENEAEPKLFPEEYVKALREENKARRMENLKLKGEIEALKAEMADFLSAAATEIGIGGASTTEDNGKVMDSVLEGLRGLKSTLVYSAFFSEATMAGLAPEIVPDAYRLSDLGAVAINQKTGEVSGVSEAVAKLLDTRPYLFSVRPVDIDIGAETNPPMGEISYPLEIEGLASELGVSPEFTLELNKKRAARAGGKKGISEIWRRPKVKKLSIFQR